MPDLSHQYGDDLSPGPTGDLAVVSNSTLGQQRVLRRLLTNNGDYIWQVEYGAGLAQFIGEPASVAQVRAVIRGQIFKESAVAQTPEPVINVSFDGAGTLFADIRYVDSISGQTQVMTFSAGS